jgi:hypothetical protein
MMFATRHRATTSLLIIALLTSGLLAGGNVDRAVVAMPAWKQVGAEAWAAFSRHADLGNGLFLYPVEAVGGAVLALAAAITIHLGRSAPRSAVIALYVAALLAAGGLLLTAKAAPIMLGVSDLTQTTSLRNAFEGFWYWGNLRAVCQIMTFVAQLASCAAILDAKS